MVSQTISRNQPGTADLDTGTNDDNPEAVTLPLVELVGQLPPPEPVERKPGGPLDRFTWMKPAARELTGAGFKFVFALVGYANDAGRCWPSHARLRLDTGLSDSGLRKGQREAVKAGWVVVEEPGKGRGSSHHRLTGAATGWVRVSPEEQSGCHQSNDRTLPSSSTHPINPGTWTSSSERDPEPANIGARFDETGGRKRKGPEGTGRASHLAPEPSMTEEPTDSAPQPPRPGPIHHPDRPPSSWMPGYVEAMLVLYRKTWLAEWDMYRDAGNYQDGIAKVVRHYSKHWDKFLTDLNRHRGNERANVGYAEGLRAMGDDGVVLAEQIELAHCDRCGADTARPKGPVMMIGGKRTADACYECSG